MIYGQTISIIINWIIGGGICAIVLTKQKEILLLNTKAFGGLNNIKNGNLESEKIINSIRLVISPMKQRLQKHITNMHG